MLILKAEEFISLLHSLLDTESKTRKMAGQILGDGLLITGNATKEIISLLKELDLPVSIKTAEQMLVGCGDYEKLHSGIQQLANTVMLELHGRRFYGPLRRYEQYYERPELFGDEVFKNLPSANEDIQEAGTCLALERATASVMHLMRVLEAGLAVLAKTLGVTKQNDWGRYLREIDDALAAWIKASGARSADEQFYAEVATTIDHMRRAWRNPTMHRGSSRRPRTASSCILLNLGKCKTSKMFHAGMTHVIPLIPST
jgi:hypothetical protein